MKKSRLALAVLGMAVLAAAQSTNDNMKNDSMKQDHTKGEKVVMGCVRSNNGSYMLQEGNGKMAMLTGSQDLSAHVGHTVALHGMWQKGDMAGMSHDSGSMSDKSSDSGMSKSSDSSMSSGSGNMNSSGSGMGASGSSGDMKKMKMDHKGGSFMVNSVDMKSSSCDMPMKDKSKMQ